MIRASHEADDVRASIFIISTCQFSEHAKNVLPNWNRREEISEQVFWKSCNMHV